MITVAIYINEKCIRTIRAVNKSGVRVCKYEILESGKVIKHKRKDGAVELGIKMLEETKEMSDKEIRMIHLKEVAERMRIEEMLD